MPLITEAFEYFIEEKPDIAQDFLSALSLSYVTLGNCSAENSMVLDFRICHALYIITSICESLKTAYGHQAAAEGISFSPALPNITLNQLRNYLYHYLIIPQNTRQKSQLKGELTRLLHQFERGFSQTISIGEFSENPFLKKVDAILLEQHAFNHFGGQNIFLKARNIRELCISFPTEIYAIPPLKAPKTNSVAHNKALNEIMFGDEGYFCILNNLEKGKDFEQKPEINAFSKNIKRRIGEQFMLWTEACAQQVERLIKTPGAKGRLQRTHENLLKLSQDPINFEDSKFSVLSDFLLDNINQLTNEIKNLGTTFKATVFTNIIDIIEQEKKPLLLNLLENTNEIDGALIQCYIASLEALFVEIESVKDQQLKFENEKLRVEEYYHTKLQAAISTFYKKDPEEYKKFIRYLTQAIGIQPSSYMPPFLKTCTNLILQLEDSDSENNTNIVREALLSEIDHNYSRISDFLRIFREITDDSSLKDKTNIPAFGSEMYLIVSMNACLKTIENIECLCEDNIIKAQIAYIRSELGMRCHHEIEHLNPNELFFFELISSYSGIGKSIANFRHYSTTLDPKIKENIQWLYAAFHKETPYHSPENEDMLNFTDLFKVEREEIKSATGFNKARKIMTLCFDRILTCRLNMLVLQRQETKKIDNLDIKIDVCTPQLLDTNTMEYAGKFEQIDTVLGDSKQKIKMGIGNA